MVTHSSVISRSRKSRTLASLRHDNETHSSRITSFSRANVRPRYVHVLCLLTHDPKTIPKLVRTRSLLLKMASRMTTRKELTLKERVAVLEYARKNPKEGTRKLSEVFQCRRTQIQSILESREKIMESFRANDPLLRKRKRESELSDTVYRWYSLARERDIPVTGPMLQEALKIGGILGEKEFKASNGWLSNFKKRHNTQFVVSGESAEVREVVAAWYDRLQSLRQL